MRRWLVLIAIIVSSTSLASAKHKFRNKYHDRGDYTYSAPYRDYDRYEGYRDYGRYGDYRNLPPGLAKRGGNLPPGIAKKMHRRNGSYYPYSYDYDRYPELRYREGGIWNPLYWLGR